MNLRDLLTGETKNIASETKPVTELASENLDNDTKRDESVDTRKSALNFTDIYGANADAKPGKDKDKVLGNWTINTPFVSIAEKGNVAFVRILNSVEPFAEKSYREVIKLLECADFGKHIHMSFSNIGGSVEIGTRIIGAMKKTKAKVYTEIDPFGYSMAAYMWAYGDHVIFKYGALMFHTISFGIQGKSGYIKNRAGSVDDYAKRHLLAMFERGLLTSDEINTCLAKCKDLFIPASAMQDRIRIYNSKNRYMTRMAKLKYAVPGSVNEEGDAV